ncbi:hypothetical protein PTE30175_03218 [Pandoraea terrae]|uniref:Bacteriophage N4 adsorption protein B n=1 Tax=Pandoraea terrae TaxID=1537710 RepID=A0A5E4WHF0_9BURK|nr:hypothetical protein [Pandoraea terrae]VVE24272.1 hypothetical protein PTE30175_03218 [Pandoraea terrae]
MGHDANCVGLSPASTLPDLSTQRPQRSGLSVPGEMNDWGTTEVHIESALAKWLPTHTANAFDAAAGERERFGELLVLGGKITPDQLADALSEQCATGERLGHLLTQKGWITNEERDAILAFQAGQVGHDGPLRLGKLLLAAGCISRQQLDDAVTRQKTSPKKLGEVLVDAGYVNPGQVSRSLRLQRRLIKASLVFLLSSLGAAGIEPALAEGPTHVLAVTAVVLPSVRMNVQKQMPELTVTSPDLERGYIDIPAASVVDIAALTSQGFTLSFDTALPIFSAVDIVGLNGSARLGADGGTVTQREAGRVRKTLTLGYRFYLSKGVRPGTYAWPLVLSAAPADGAG